MTGAAGYPAPAWAYVPGQTERHPDGAFDTLRDTAREGMTPLALAHSDAWQAGMQFLETGFFWEAHEVLEPVWMALPASGPERVLAQAVIQIANAELKRRMGRPGAVLRLCHIAEGLLGRGTAAADILNVNELALEARIQDLRAWANQ